MRRDREQKDSKRVTRRSGDAYENTRRNEYSYFDDHDDRDDRRSRDDRDERDYRRSRDDRDDRDDRRSRDDRDDRGRKPRSVTRSSKEPEGRREGNPDRTVHQLVPYALFCLSVFAGVSFFLRDFANLDGQTGTFGSLLAEALCGLLGVIAYAVPVFAFVMALRWRFYVKKGRLLKKLVLSNAFLVLLSGIVHVFQDATRGTLATTVSDLYYNGVERVGGGIFGGFVGEWIGYVLRMPGTIILAIPLLVIIAIYLIDMTPSSLGRRISMKYRVMKKKHSERRAAMYDGKEEPSRKEKAQRKPDKEQGPIAVTRWSEPRSLEPGTPFPDVFSFSDEEDEPIVLQSPFASGRPERAPQPESSDAVQPPASEPVGARPVVAPDVVEMPSAAQAPSPESVLQQTVREPITAQPAQEQTLAQPVTQAAKPSYDADPVQRSGQVFAPFALPVQPFPDRAARSSAQEPPAQQGSSPAETKVEPQAVPVSEDTDEILGAFAPFSRPTASPESPRSQPTVSSPVFASVVAEPSAEQEMPAAQTEVWEKPETLTPFASFIPVKEEKEAAPESDELPVQSPFAPADAFAFSDEDQPTPQEQDKPLAFDDLSAEGEDDEETDDGYAPTSTLRFDREYVAPLQAQGFGGVMQEDESEATQEDEQEDEFTPISVQTERVEPQAIVTPTYAPVSANAPVSPVAPRVAVKATPVRTEPEEIEPIVYEYKCPPIDLLKEDENVRTDNFYQEIEETKDILRQTMASFNIRIQEEINYSHGPSVTRYEMRPVAGTSVRSVTNRTEDIALNLASSVRIEAPIPGKPAIGIEVPNKVRETVYMRTMLESAEFKSSTDPLDVPLGLDVGGDVRMCNLAKMPHLLVAGTTGSGKSVCINSMLVSLIYKTSPKDLRLILIDPKQIEFAPYEDVPHLYMPIVTDMQRASGALACAVQEMERRFSLIKDVGVRNIEAYNEAVKNDPDREHLPYIIIVIDEFADLKMSCNNNDPENFTCRIAQKARAAGIHLIIGTQRPSVDVITGKLKTNIPSRIAFMVKQQVDSRTILDVNGAEALTGRGDMLYVATTSSDKNPVRIQGAFVSDGELERVVSFVRRNNPPVQYNRAFMDQIEVEMARANKSDRKGDDFDYAEEEDGGEDPKFVEAVELSIQVQKVATSLLQRRLGVGYGRAAKIIDRMEELGFVTPAEGNKPRKVLPAAQGYLEHIGAMGADGEEFEDEFDQ